MTIKKWLNLKKYLPVHQFLVYQKDCKDTLPQIDFDHSLTQQIVYRIILASLHHMLPMPLLNLKFRLEKNLDPVVQNELNYAVNDSYLFEAKLKYCGAKTPPSRTEPPWKVSSPETVPIIRSNIINLSSYFSRYKIIFFLFSHFGFRSECTPGVTAGPLL